MIIIIQIYRIHNNNHNKTSDRKFTCLMKQDTPLYISGLLERIKCPMRAPGLASSATLSNLGPVKKAD